MRKAKDSAGPLIKLNRNKKHKLESCYNILDVPPELWGIIASFASRQSVARLCSVSHRFCSLFSPLLYANLVDPPLTGLSSSRLIETLGASQTSRSKPHPATLIRQLGLTDGRGDRSRKSQHAISKPQPETLINALQNLHTLAPGATTGSALRALHWNLAPGVDELGRIFGLPGSFPNLKELTVSCDGHNKNFNFVQIRGLEVLGLNLDLRSHTFNEDYGETGNKACYKLAEAMQMLPVSSPLLHQLQMQLIIPFEEFEPCPFEGHKDLVDTMNLIHLPALTTLDLSVNLDPEYAEEIDPDGPFPTNFFPFLNSHPYIMDLTLNVPGTQLPNDVVFLPHLRSFKGSFEDAAVICGPRRQLDKLVLTLIQPRDCPSYGFPEFRTQPLPTHLSLKKLHVLAVDRAGSTIKSTNELSPSSLKQLVSSFPNLIHLDICIQGQIAQYRETLILLTKLQSLRVQEWRINCEVEGKSKTSPFIKIFPPREYIDTFNLFLPFLPQLAQIEISLLGDNVEFWCDLEDDFDLSISPPTMTGTYHFSVTRPSSGAKIILDNARCRNKHFRTKINI